MALEIEGKLIKLLPEQNGQGKNGAWTKQDFVIETFGEYPKKICFSTWNDKAKEIKDYPVGSVLKVAFSAESREYNERWYTDLRAYRFGGNQAKTAPVAQPTPEQEEEDDVPF